MTICTTHRHSLRVSKAARPEPAPTQTKSSVAVIELIRAEFATRQCGPVERERLDALLPLLEERSLWGQHKYGTKLMTYNGRDFAVDLNQELSDAVMYAAGARAEGKITGLTYQLIVFIASLVAQKYPVITEEAS